MQKHLIKGFLIALIFGISAGAIGTLIIQRSLKNGFIGDLMTQRIRRARPELFHMERDIIEPKDFDDELAVSGWCRQIDEQDKECQKIAQGITDEEFPSDYCMFIIDKGEQGKMEIELDTYAQEISVSYSGNKKLMDAILKDIHSFFGVSQADIEYKTDRYKTLVAVLSI